MSGDARRHAGDERQRAHGLEHRVEVGEIRLGLLHDAAERLEHAALGVHYASHTPIDRHATQILPPRDPHALEVAIQRRGEPASVFGDRDRRSRVRPGDRAQHQRDIGDASRHRAIDAQRGPRGRRGPRRDTPRRRPQSDDAAETGGVAKRSAHVGAVGDRQHVGRKRHRRPTAAATAGLAAVVRVQRRAEHRIERLRSGAKFRRVRLADTDRSGMPEALDGQRILRRHEVSIDRRSERRPHPLGGLEILVRDRQAVQRPDLFTARIGLVRQTCACHRPFGDQRDNCIDVRVHAINLREMRADDIAGGELLRPNQANELDRTLGADVGDHDV